ncbi:hypothetical protein [Prochlorococcus sp. MIT 1300]|uniref:hypothetical protein n=1 Tax=Prochlorococcus sp. MIT 1300 TaxID=3096218 RepID=UPI002A760DE3|nr:hypothetical protein [Prochlorococcus sp. MIT 1300]
MTNTPDIRSFDWIKILNGVALLLCALCLAFIAVNLRPMAQWANNQNICVEQEITKSKAPISWGVRKCNGRSKVYQVK